MPNLPSAAKRARQSEQARIRNARARSGLSTLRRRLFEAEEAGDPARLETMYRAYCSALDKRAKQGIIPANTAVRRKTRAAAKLRRLSKTTPTA